MPLWGFLLSFVTATLWAVSPVLAGQGLVVPPRCTSNEINPIRSIAYMGAAVTIALFYTHGHPTIVTSPLALLYIFLGVFTSYTIGDVMYFIAIRDIGVSLAIPISNAYPMLVVLTSWLVLGEEVTVRILIGVAIVIAGLLLLRFGGPKEDESPSAEPVNAKRRARGFLFAIGAGCAWALGGPVTKLSMIESGLGPVEITAYRSIVFFFVTIIVRAATVRLFPASCVPLSKVAPKAWGYFCVSAVIGLVLGSILYADCIRVMPVAIVTAITATSPFMSALFGHFALHQKLLKPQWCGVIAIIAGSIMVSL